MKVSVNSPSDDNVDDTTQQLFTLTTHLDEVHSYNATVPAQAQAAGERLCAVTSPAQGAITGRGAVVGGRSPNTMYNEHRSEFMAQMFPNKRQ